ncbi:MAG TPA: hypothetical protein VMR59_04735 [Patescibacteria group bacterium]|nr:hypothetical protein [Patescibacteria group bacterium]
MTNPFGGEPPAGATSQVAAEAQAAPVSAEPQQHPETAGAYSPVPSAEVAENAELQEAHSEELDPEEQQLASEVKSSYHRAASELKRLGQDAKAEEILGRIPAVTEAARELLVAERTLIERRRALSAARHPESRDAKDALLDAVAEVNTQKHGAYGVFVDIPDDYVGREEAIQSTYDVLGIDKTKAELMPAVGGRWGDGTNIVRSYTGYRAENDKYGIVEARDWPEGKEASALDYMKTTDPRNPEPIKRRPTSGQNFTRVLVYKVGSNTNVAM